MTVRRTTTWGMILVLALVSSSLAQNINLPKTESHEANPFSGKALFVTMRGGIEAHSLEDPELRRLGEREFVVGQSAERSNGIARRVWLPLGEIWKIEEFTDAKEMAKVYRFEAATK